MYHLRHVCYLHIEFRIQFLAPECLLCHCIKLIGISYGMFSGNCSGVASTLASRQCYVAISLNMHRPLNQISKLLIIER